MTTLGRNDKCACGSGKKYKQCCMHQDASRAFGMKQQANEVAPAFQRASVYHQAGRLAEAEAVCRQILQLAPRHPETLHLLGMIAYQTGNHDIAVDLINQAIAADPSKPEYYNILGNIFIGQGKLDAADSSYRKVLALQPRYAEAYCGLGNVYYKQGNLDDAVTSYRKALLLNPNYTTVYNNLGNACMGQGKLNEAVANYRKAVSLKADYITAHNNLGLVYMRLEKWDAAVDSFKKVLASNPNDVTAHNNLGNVFMGQGKLNDAIASYQKALSLSPLDGIAHNNLAIAFMDLGKLDEAVAIYQKMLSFTPDQAGTYLKMGDVFRAQGNMEAAVGSYHKALALQPDYAEAYNSLGALYREQGNESDAVASFKHVTSLQPDNAEAHNNLGNAHMAQGKLEESLASYRKALSLKPNFTMVHNNLGVAILNQGKADEAMECFRQALLLKPDYVAAHSNFLMAMQYSSTCSQTEIFNAHRSFSEQFETPLRQHWPLHKNSPDPERRLKVGFVSGDFRTHPVGFFIEAVLAHLNRQDLEVVLYYNHTLTDEVTLRLKNLGYLWRSLAGVTDDHAAKLVCDDGIDILIDLSGHTNLNRLQLFARKSAPVQVTWLGYFDTTGLQAMDYILGDPYVLPPDEVDHYVEKPWCLPASYLCYTPPQNDVKIEEPPAIRNGFITFGCFNNLAKLNDEVVALWARILRVVPDSRLFLKTILFNDPAVQQAVSQRFFCYGIDAGRLICEGWSSNDEHFSAYNRMDIALDPFPFPGGTTSVNALWMGVPLLHLQGHRFISHVGESILINLGHPEWIAANTDAYVRLATELAGNLQQLEVVRAGLRRQLLASPLCDAPRFARNFEDALRGMWQQWCSKNRR